MRSMEYTPDESAFDPGVKYANGDFENYCSACDNYPGKDMNEIQCPFKDKVTPDTEWKKLGCQYFWD